MKQYSFIFIFILFGLNLSVLSQGRDKKKPTPSEGGFVICKFVCSEHDKNCRYYTGHHKITATNINSGTTIGTYEGNFLNGRFHGEGHEQTIYMNFKGKYSYGYPKEGTLILPAGDTLIGTFKAKGEKWYFDEGKISSYSWYTLNDDPSDKSKPDKEKTGTADKMILRGNVSDGQLNGKIYYKVLTGNFQNTEFQGNYTAGKIDGCAIMKMKRKDNHLEPTTNNNEGFINFATLNPDGDIYYGQFKDNIYNGWGVLFSENTPTQIGLWQNDIIYKDYPATLVTAELKRICNFDIILENNFDNIGTSISTIEETLRNQIDTNKKVFTNISVQTPVNQDERGNETNAFFIKYELNYATGYTQGDYGVAKYYVEDSKNVTLLLNDLSSTIQLMQEEYKSSTSNELLNSNSQIEIKIFSSTDKIGFSKNGVPYNPKDTINFPKKIKDSICYVYNPEKKTYIAKKVTLNQKRLNKNSQLAYLRALAVKGFIQNNIDFKTKNIIYKYYIDTTSDNRTISFEIFIKNEEINNEKNDKLKQLKRAEVQIPELKTRPTTTDSTKVVLIYIDNYNSSILSDNSLKYAKNDAILLEKYFTTSFGIKQENIEHLYNNDASILKIDEVFFKKIPDWTKEGYSDFYIYFQGHGYANENKNLYFMPQDVDFDKGGNVKLNYGSLFIDSLAGYINKAISVSNYKANIFCLYDACAEYSNNKSTGLRRTAKLSIDKSNNLCFIAASQMFEVAKYDTELEHSLLSYAFCLALCDYELSDNNKNGEISLKEVSDYIIKYVSERSLTINIENSYRQVPKTIGSGNWNKVLLTKKNINQKK